MLESFNNTISIESNESNESKSFNPNQIMYEQARRMMNIFKAKSRIDTDQFANYEQKQIERLFDLMNDNREKYRLNDKYHDSLIDNVFDIYKSLPKINDLQSLKPVEPVFDIIETDRSDSLDTQKFIRKTNFEFVGYHCNHSTLNEKSDAIFKNTTDIYNSSEYRQYSDFVRELGELIGRIIVDFHEDESSSSDDYSDDLYGCCNWFPTYEQSSLKVDSSKVKATIEAVIQLNGKIASCNSKSVKKCSRCEAAKRKYEYCLREINRMRNDFKEQQQIDKQFKDQPGEMKYDIDKFMNENYPTIKRIPLSDVQERYKAVFGLFVKQDDLTTMIESTKRFNITNTKNKRYVNRI